MAENNYDLFGEVKINTGGIEQAADKIGKSFKELEKTVQGTTEKIDNLGTSTEKALNGTVKKTKKQIAEEEKYQKKMKAVYQKLADEQAAIQNQINAQKDKGSIDHFEKEKALQEKASAESIKASKSVLISKKNDTETFLKYQKTALSKIKYGSDTKARTPIQSVNSVKTEMNRLDRAYDAAMKKTPTNLTSKDVAIVDNYTTAYSNLIAELDKYQKKVDKEANVKNKADMESYVKKASKDAIRSQKADETALANYTKRTYKEATDDILNNYRLRSISGQEAINKMQSQLKTLQPAYDAISKKTTALNPKEKAIVSSYTNIKKAINGVKTGLADADNKQMDFVKNAVKWSTVYKLINAVWTSFKDGLKTLNDIDDALVNIRKVTNMSASEGQMLARNGATEVSNYGRTVQDYLGAYEMFAKAGFRDQTLDNLTNLSLLLQNVGDITAEVANKTLIAANAGFKLGGSYEKLQHIVDSMNNISNNNAVTIEKMSEAITVSASVAQTAGFAFDEYISIIGAAAANTQREGSVIGRAVRTIVSNILKVKDAEADTDEDTFAKAGASLKRIAEIDLTTTTGSMKSVMVILTELAGKWSTLTDLQRQELAGNIANKQQIDVFLGLMNNWETVQKQLTEAVNSTGSAYQENQTYLDGITAKTNEFKNAITSLWLNAIETGLIKTLISLTTDFVRFIDTIGMANIAVVVLSGLFIGKVIPAIIGAAKAFKAAQFAISLTPWGAVALIVAGIVTGLIALNNISKQTKSNIDELNQKVTEFYDNFTEGQNDIDNAIKTYKDLAGNTSLTSDESIALGSAVVKLNGLFSQYNIKQEQAGSATDKTTLFIDAQTTSIEKLDSAIKVLTEKRLEELKALLKQGMEEANYLLNNTSLDSFLTSTNPKGFLDSLDELMLGVKTKAEKEKDEFKKILTDFIPDVDFGKLESVYNSITQLINNPPKQMTKENVDLIQKYYKILYTQINDARSAQEKYNLVLARQKELADSMNKSGQTEDLFGLLTRVGSEAAEVVGTLSDNFDSLNDAITTLNDEKKLTSEQFTKLTTAYPELLNYMNMETGEIEIQSSILKAIAVQKAKDIKEDIENYKVQIADKISGNSTILTLYEKEVKALKILSKAQIQAAKDSVYAKVISSFNGDVYGPRVPFSIMDEQAKEAANQVERESNAYNSAAEEIRKLIGLTHTYATASDKVTTSSERAKLELERVEAQYKLLRDSISVPFEEKDISALTAFQKMSAEIAKLSGTYERLRWIAENKLTELEKALISHYEAMVSLNQGFLSEIQSQYDDAVSNIESLQEKLATAIKAKYEEQKKTALDAIEAQRKAENDAFDARIKELEAEKEALEDTRKEDDENLDTLKKKFELSKLDNSVFGKKRQADLEKQIADLEKKIAISKIDDEIKAAQDENEDKNKSYDDQIKAITKTYDDMLEESRIYAEANKLILENNMKEIVALLEQFAPDFSGIGQLFGASLASEIIKEVTAALSAITTIKAGVPSIDAGGGQPSGGGTEAPSANSLSWDGKNYTSGSKGGSVPRIQKNLIAKGYNVGSSGADGVIGKDTLAAIKKFQKDFGLSIDGIVGKNTWAKLIAFKSGGIPSFKKEPNGGVAIINAKERILSARQTDTFDNFVFGFLPSFKKFLHSFDNNDSSSSTNVNVNVEMNNNINSKFDEENLADNFTRVIKKGLFAKGIGVN